MKKLYFLLSTLLITSLSFGQMINEFQPNPTGTDPATVSLELKGTATEMFNGFILFVEGDPTTTGIIQDSEAVSGTFDANGLLNVSISDVENPSFTIILVDTYSGMTGTTDIDTNDDGIIDDSSAWGSVYDAIGIPDDANVSTLVYGSALGGADFAYTGDEPGLIFRDSTTDDWYAINDPAGTDAYDISANTVPFANFSSDPSITSFGSVNPSNTTASAEDNKIQGFSFSPNPTSLGYVNITSRSTSTMRVNVFDVLGKQVINSEVKNNRLDVSSLNTGMYIMKVSQDNATTTKKLVIK